MRTRYLGRMATKTPDERIEQLVAASLARAPTKPLPIKLLSTPPPKSEESVLAALIEDRRDGR